MNTEKETRNIRTGTRREMMTEQQREFPDTDTEITRKYNRSYRMAGGKYVLRRQHDGTSVSGNALISQSDSDKGVLGVVREGTAVQLVSLSSRDGATTSPIVEILDVTYKKGGRLATWMKFTTQSGSIYELSLL